METTRLKCIASAVLACVLASPAPGRDLKLLKVGEPDATDIRSLVASITAGCKTDQERSIAIWGYVARSKYYHWAQAIENPEGTTELGIVIDPICNFNVYGTVICYQVADLLAAMCEQAGIKTRDRSLPGHMVSEFYYDGGWHLFDATYDCASYCHADDGTTIVSVDTICSDSTKYIINQAHPSNPFFQFDHYGGKFWPWETKQYCATNFYKPSVIGTGITASRRRWGHSIHLDLRRGERLVRRWSNQGKWYCPAAFHTKWRDDPTQVPYVDKGPHDPRNPKNHYVNGTLIYEPDWAGHENNLLDGLYQGLNYVRQGGKVGPAGPGDCHVIVRMHSPYLIAGKPGTLSVDGDSHSGAIVEADFHRADVGATNSLAVSTDNGITWTTVWTNDTTGDRHLKLDVTNQVEGSYGYLLKITLLGDNAAEANVSNLKLTNHLFLSAAPLPAVKPGMNRFQFCMKPQEAVYWIKPDMGSSPRYLDFFHELNNLGYDTHFAYHLRPPWGQNGHAIVQVAPPAGWQVRWLTVTANYYARSASCMARVLYATDPAGRWTFASKGDFENSAHWRQDRTQDIYLRAPANPCYVKFRLRRDVEVSLNTYRLYAHCTRPEPALPPGMVKVTHEWFEDGAAKAKTVFPDYGGHSYRIRALGSNIVNRAVTIEVANEEIPAAP